ncbi:uncharacterized mitochondrial protein-like protein [Tanacetum coccineum]
MCDKKNYVLFTDSECLVLSPNFKFPDENQILLKIPRQDNMYSFDMKNIIPKDGLTCLVAKATSEGSMLWHRRLGHVNFKNLNKLVKENLVRDFSLKRFEIDQHVFPSSESVATQSLLIENKPMIEGNGPKWLFDLDSLTQSMNYVNPDKVYKVVKALYGLHQAPRAWELCDELCEAMKDKFQMSLYVRTTFLFGDLQVQQTTVSIFISQDKYVHEILRKFNYSDVKSASTPTDLEKPLVQDGDAADVDEHLYRS